MQNDIFLKLGRGIFQGRWWIILSWVVVFICLLPTMPHLMDPFKAIGFVDTQSESAKTNVLLNKKLNYSYNRIIVMYHNDKPVLKEAKYLDQIKASLAGLNQFSMQHEVIYPEKNNHQISIDKHSAYAVILLKGDQEVTSQQLADLKKSLIAPADLSMKLGGEPVFLDDTKNQTQADLYKAEYIATPVAIVTMLIIFGSVVAASLPVILGGVSALFILFVLYGLGHVFSLSVFTINIALLVGLCLNLDYAILMVSRFREELQAGHTVEIAIAKTVKTAGKSVFFSGLVVLISLSALLLFRINILFSVGVGGLAAVSVAMLIAIMLLPAILSVIGVNINRFTIPFLRDKRMSGHSIWYRFIGLSVKKPAMMTIIILWILLLLGYPFLYATFGISDFRILPKQSESRQAFETFQKSFGESSLAPLLALVQTTDKSVLSAKNISDLYDYVSDLKKDSRIDTIISVVSLDSRLSKKDYQDLYAKSEQALPNQLNQFIHNTTHDDTTLMTIISRYPSRSNEVTALIEKMRHDKLPGNLQVSLTGTSVNTLDVLHSISETFWKAFLWIIFFTYLILCVLLRSLILPIKAIVTTMLSLCASYGVLVLVIQHGFLHDILHFEPQGMLDISLLIIIFCALFGISMDYEVFLLTRIKEYYEQTGNTQKSIIMGIDRSSKIITSAAIIIILLCCSFMTADILMVKAFGLGIAVAVFVDAFIIRILFVPAVMTLLNQWNWYLPKWLDRVMPSISFDPHDKI